MGGAREAIVEATNAEVGDIFLIWCGSNETAATLGAVRTSLGKELGLIDEYRFDFLWVEDGRNLNIDCKN